MIIIIVDVSVKKSRSLEDKCLPNCNSTLISQQNITTIPTNTTAKQTSTTTITTTTTTTTTTISTTTSTIFTTTATKTLDWCHLIDHSVEKLQRLNSGKNIVILNETDDQIYDYAKAICESICGNLYFPATQEENDQVESVFDTIPSYSSFVNRGNVWIRLFYDEAENKWYDADNKGGGLS